MNYAAKWAKVKRRTTFDVALVLCPNLKFIHVSTLIDENGQTKLVESSVCKYVKVLKKDESVVKQLDEDVENDYKYRV